MPPPKKKNKQGLEKHRVPRSQCQMILNIANSRLQGWNLTSNLAARKDLAITLEKQSRLGEKLMWSRQHGREYLKTETCFTFIVSNFMK